MCYFLRLASPLTLSEVRAMLPPGLAASAGTPAEVAWLRGMLPAAQTVAHLGVGACACDLVRPRDSNPREDERHLRERYFRMGLDRDTIVAEQERHRRGAAPGGAVLPHGPRSRHHGGRAGGAPAAAATATAGRMAPGPRRLRRGAR